MTDINFIINENKFRVSFSNYSMPIVKANYERKKCSIFCSMHSDKNLLCKILKLSFENLESLNYQQLVL